MDLASFIDERRSQWRKLESLLTHVEGSGLGTLDDVHAVEFARLYRRTASDLNQAQTYIAGDATVRYLNDLVARSYLVIYSGSKIHWWATIWAFVRDYPLVFRRYFGHFLLAAILLAAGVLFGFVAAYYDADVARGFLLPTDMPMIQPGQEGPLQSAGQLAGFSGLLFRHNVSVSLVAFALGITFGIGTAWLMFENGIVLGALAAVFLEAGQVRGFLTGILPHGVLEIPACLIGGAGGFVLAQAVVRARPWPRLEELARTGRKALWLVAGCLPLLAVAAILEAVVARAPDWFLDSGLKLAVAALFGLLFVAYLVLPGWRTKGDARSIKAKTSSELQENSVRRG
jgi:uncharacterized membrane protein SpoIIM required for sporulation